MISLLLSLMLATEKPLESKFLDELCDFKTTCTTESYPWEILPDESDIEEEDDEDWCDLPNGLYYVIGEPLEFVVIETAAEPVDHGTLSPYDFTTTSAISK